MMYPWLPYIIVTMDTVYIIHTIFYIILVTKFVLAVLVTRPKVDVF